MSNPVDFLITDIESLSPKALDEVVKTFEHMIKLERFRRQADEDIGKLNCGEWLAKYGNFMMGTYQPDLEDRVIHTYDRSEEELMAQLALIEDKKALLYDDMGDLIKRNTNATI